MAKFLTYQYFAKFLCDFVLSTLEGLDVISFIKRQC